MKAVRLISLAVAGACLLATAAQAGDAWRWKENGRWVYGDKFPRGAINPERVLSLDTRGATEKPVGSANANAAKLFPVVVYGAGCGGCEATMKLLGGRNIPSTTKDPGKPEIYDEFKKHSPQSLAPVILIGEKVVVGFDEAALNGALDDAGYEKLVLPATAKAKP